MLRLKVVELLQLEACPDYMIKGQVSGRKWYTAIIQNDTTRLKSEVLSLARF